MNIQKYLFFIFIILASCKSKNKESIVTNDIAIYKMISYESKAWLDSNNFPILKIDNNAFEFYVKGKKIKQRELIFEKDVLKFDVQDNECVSYLSGTFLNKEKSLLRIKNIVGIEVEAKYGDFKRIE